MGAEVAFGAFHGIVPVTLFPTNAVRNIRPVLIKTPGSWLPPGTSPGRSCFRRPCPRSSPGSGWGLR